MDFGQWLIDHRAGMDRAEAEWLERLAEFDREGLWALDGQFCCGTWLVWRTNMARSTAFETLRVAHELHRRPIVAEAFREGRLSYSAARAITRMERPDPAVDEALVALAESGGASIVDIERVVRSYNLYADQDRPPDDGPGGRDVKILRDEDGTGQLVTPWVRSNSRSSRPRCKRSWISSTGPTLWRSLQLETPRRERRPRRNRTGRRRRPTHSWTSIRTALAHADGGRATADDRYLVHLVSREGGPMSNLDGRPLLPADAALLACDKSMVAHYVGEAGEPVRLGRKTRQWNTAQRRAISVRDGGHCRFVGCYFGHYDIHHLRPWEHGGNTDVDNGCCQCPRHHRMLHAGYSVEGDPNGELRFYRPDRSYLGSTNPVAVRQLAGV